MYSTPSERPERRKDAEVRFDSGSGEGPQEILREPRCVSRQQGQDQRFEEREARHEHKPQAEDRKPCQTEPTDLLHLPGVEPRNAKQAEEGNSDGQQVDHQPCATW